MESKILLLDYHILIPFKNHELYVKRYQTYINMRTQFSMFEKFKTLLSDIAYFGYKVKYKRVMITNTQYYRYWDEVQRVALQELQFHPKYIFIIL